MKKKIKFSILLILCVAFAGTVLFFGMNTLKAEATERGITASGVNGKVNWTLYDDGELFVEGTGYWNAAAWKTYSSSIKKIAIGKNVTVPSALNFYLDNASGYSVLESVTVENGNTDFYSDESGVLYSYDKTKLFLFPNASGLTEYNIPDSVITIVKGAFCGNKTLTKITGCKGLKTIEENSFYICSSLKSITLPEGLSAIGYYAFFKCASLEEIIISDNVTILGNYAFKGCSALTDVSIGNGVTKLPLEIFMDCTNLENVSLGNNIKFIDSSVFKNCSKIADISLPQDVTVIEDYAFQNCTSLKNIVIPEGVTVVSTSAFNGCTTLKTVTLPASLKQIDMSAFLNCSSVKNVYYTGDSAGWCSITFSNVSSNPLYYADNLYIGGKLVTEFVVPEGITTINNFLFYKLDNLTSITIPDSVTAIGANAFYYCSNLNNISVSDNLEHIGDNAFFKSGYYNDYANWDNGFLYLENYLLEIDDNTVAAECNLYSKTKLVASRAFYNSDKITSITMSDGVEHINTEAFYSCDNLESVKLSSSLKKISKSSFSNCTALKAVIIPESVTTIEEKAFYGCKTITEVVIPGNVSVIGSQAFYGCEKLEKVTVNEGLAEIRGSAFAANPLLTEIYLPETLTVLSSSAFKSSGITDIYYGSTKAKWKRVVSGATFSGITVHYTLKSEGESVIIHHTDNNFNWESGNVHLAVEDLGNATSSYEQNGFYNRLMVDPIQVLDIKLVDGDGNDIQPLSDETITVKIKASEEFMNLMKSGLKAVSEYDVEAKDIDFFNDCFMFAVDGETVSVPADESFLKKFKVIHWYSDATQPTDHESFTHEEICVENGYIVLETNHFSEYAVCTEYKSKIKYTINFDTAGGTEIAPITLEYGEAITPPANPEKEGFTFIGWNPELPETMPENDLTVVAEYEEAETPDIPDTPDKPEATVTGIIIISLPNKTQYAYKVDSLDLSGLAIKMMYSDGTSKIISNTKAVNVYGFNVDSVGTKTVTVSYGGYTDEFEITVSYAWWQWIIRILLLGFIWY